MKFGMGSNTERTQKYARVKVQMTYVRPHIITNKQTSPIFNCVTPESVSLARQLVYRSKSWSHKPLDYGKSDVERSYGTVSM